MPNAAELAHAQHDEGVALFIHQAKKSDQWTIIVCFYSALHYIRAKIFPLTEIAGGVTTTYNSANDYYSKLGPNKGSLHDTLVTLAWRELPTIAAKYQLMYNSSTTARYNNYAHDPRASAQAISNLAAIKKECTKP
jgi:hypothetical protein